MECDFCGSETQVFAVDVTGENDKIGICRYHARRLLDELIEELCDK